MGTCATRQTTPIGPKSPRLLVKGDPRRRTTDHPSDATSFTTPVRFTIRTLRARPRRPASMAWMANAHWPGRSQTRASRHMDSPRAVAPTRKSTASLQAGGTLCRMRRGAPCAAAPVAKVCTRTRARPVCFTGCPLFRANHFGPSPLPIGQGAWQGRGSLITVNIGDRVRPPPPLPQPPPRAQPTGGATATMRILALSNCVHLLRALAPPPRPSRETIPHQASAREHPL